nr:reverse transcriptase domain-containing protein [Tanacetum cinerariifolium]
MCDANDFAIGAVLGQRQEKHFRPIHYSSKTMTEAESKYTITKKEMLTVVYAFKKFRSYLIMNKSIVYTNHSALKYLFGDDKLLVIISKDLSIEEKAALIKEKSHFMVKEGIVLGHKISKNGIEVDKAKVDVIAKLPHLTTVKGIRSFLGHAGFY